MKRHVPTPQRGFGFHRDAIASESDLTATALALTEQRWDRRFRLSSSAAQIREELRQGAPAIVDAMANWALAFSEPRHPSRVVDPGAGSARFLMAAGSRFPDAQLIGIEVDPLAALIGRANLAACGYANRARVILADYRSVQLPPEDGRTLYIGNPPYVRHHLLTTEWKQWLDREAARLGYRASQLAGLHVHFFLATALHAKEGDFGAFVTASEWLDVNYGRLVRELFLNELGGQGLTIIQPVTKIFADATVTSVIGTFEVGSKPRSVRVRHVKSIDRIEPLANGRLLDRAALLSETRWSRLAKPARKAPAGYVELGELCRVHRGQVTGANRIWIAGRHSADLPPSVLFRSVTKARELFNAHGVLADENELRMVIDLPIDLTGFSGAEMRAIDRFLKLAKTEGAADGYVASNRKAWWSVGLKSAAPILATYMARRPLVFVRNLVGARHINIAHGLYPRDPLAPHILDRLAVWLSQGTLVEDGRTYAGGLTKFEPRATGVFRRERMQEPLEAYIEAFDRARGVIEDLFKTSGDLAEIDNKATDVLTNPHLLEAFRSSAGPPLSADDLKTLSEAVLSPGRLRADSAMAHRVIEVVRLGLDRRRFPWILENRAPSEHVGQVGNLRAGCQPALRPIPTLNHAPNPGEFCRESLLGSRKPDIVLRLRDHRIVPLECKVSNSALNSIKRANNDAAVKAEVWLKDFSVHNIAPAAVLSGIYKTRQLSAAQDRGLTNA